MIPNRLLIVDDQVEICEFVSEVASDCGFEVSAANTHGQFAHEYRSFKPSVIILDLSMPDGDGIELLRLLAGERCEAAILLLSGFDARVLETARRIGAELGLHMVDALQKPIDVAALEERLQRLSAAPDIGREDLERALEEQELFLLFQPKVDMESRAVPSVEALMRWEHPLRGMVNPGEFIPMFEEAGLIGRVTRYATEQACAQLRLWQEAGTSLDVAVNLSPLELENLELPDEMADIVRRFGLRPERVTIEVTESGAMEDTTRAAEILARFRLKGFRISLDDFGTGYSSLVWLQRLPFSEIKIDRSFVKDLASNREALVIVRSVVDLARNLGLGVCAEGVETQAVWTTLAEMGCGCVQGYLVSPPIQGDEVPAWVDRWRSGRPGD